MLYFLVAYKEGKAVYEYEYRVRRRRKERNVNKRN